MSRMQYSPDNGATWNPVGVLRTCPGGTDHGQTDRNFAASIGLSTTVPTEVFLGLPESTLYIADLDLRISAGSCVATLQVDGVPIWYCLLDATLPLHRSLSRPLIVEPGQTLELVFAAASGPPTVYANLGMWEQN